MHLAGATRQMTFLEAVANAVADADAITVAPGQWQAACSMQHAAPCPLPLARLSAVRSLLSAVRCRRQRQRRHRLGQCGQKAISKVFNGQTVWKGGEDLEREQEWGTVAGLLPAKGARQGDTLYRGEGG